MRGPSEDPELTKRLSQALARPGSVPPLQEVGTAHGAVSGFRSVAAGPPASAPPGNLVEIQNANLLPPLQTC